MVQGKRCRVKGEQETILVLRLFRAFYQSSVMSNVALAKLRHPRLYSTQMTQIKWIYADFLTTKDTKSSTKNTKKPFT